MKEKAQFLSPNGFTYGISRKTHGVPILTRTKRSITIYTAKGGKIMRVYEGGKVKAYKKKINMDVVETISKIHNKFQVYWDYIGTQKSTKTK